MATAWYDEHSDEDEVDDLLSSMEDLDSADFYRLSCNDCDDVPMSWGFSEEHFPGPDDMLAYVASFLSLKDKNALLYAYEDTLPTNVCKAIGKIVYKVRSPNLQMMAINHLNTYKTGMFFVEAIIVKLQAIFQTLHHLEESRNSLAGELMYVRAVTAISTFNEDPVLFSEFLDTDKLSLPHAWVRRTYRNLRIFAVQRIVRWFFDHAQFFIDVFNAKHYRSWDYMPCAIVKQMLGHVSWHMQIIGSDTDIRWEVPVEGRSRVSLMVPIEGQDLSDHPVFARLSTNGPGARMARRPRRRDG